MRILFLGNQADTLFRFRKDLILEIRKNGHEVGMASPQPDSKTLENIQQMDCSFVKISMDRTGLNPFRDIATFVSLFRVLRKLKPDMLFCFTIKPVVYGAMAGRLCGVKKMYSMVTGAGWVFMGDSWKQKLARMVAKVLYRINLKAYQTVFFLNQQDLEMFKNQKLISDMDKAVLIPGEGVNLSEFPLTPIPQGPVRFLFVGRLLRDKGTEEFVHAAEILKKRHPDARFEILGPLDSNPTGIPLSFLEEYQSRGIVEYLGKTSEVQPFLARCTVFVLPSYREGTPRASLEAMSTGRPIVTSDAPGCRETVRDGENGFLVPVKDPQALSAAMERFLLDSTLATRMGQVSRWLVEEKFDVRKVNGMILERMELIPRTGAAS